MHVWIAIIDLIINYSHPLFGCVSLTAVALMLFSMSEVYSSSSNDVTESASRCITYDTDVNVITITCKHVNLTDIDNEIKNPDILYKESTDGVWLLNAGIVIEQGASLYINSTDTSWLKIAADGDSGDTAHAILVLGS